MLRSRSAVTLATLGVRSNAVSLFVRPVLQRSLSAKQSRASKRPSRRSEASIVEMANQKVGEMVTILDSEFLEAHQPTTVRLVGKKSEEEGDLNEIMDAEEAMRIADRHSLSLVVVAAQAKPPVVRLTDLELLQAQEIKKLEEEKNRKEHIDNAKEKGMRLRPNISDHDFEIKLNRVKEFLEKGNRVAVRISTNNKIRREKANGLEETLARVDSALESHYSERRMIHGGGDYVRVVQYAPQADGT